MKSINVEHLPESAARAVAAIVDALRGQSGPEEDAVDSAKVKAAILARRKASRADNQEWEVADREVWDRPTEARK